MTNANPRRMRLVVNGKAAGDESLRAAVHQMRSGGANIEVRATWEAGDAARCAAEAVREDVDVVIAAGGDGTINEVAAGMLSETEFLTTALSVVPYGTANDFATGMGITKGDPLTALRLAAEGDVVRMDVGQVNDRVFVNVASGGFGAEVTASTPPQLKKALGGVAYSLMGVVTAAKMSPIECRFTAPDGEQAEGALLILAVGNGRQCGGGYQVAPQALLNDGLLDVMVVHDADVSQFGLVLGELMEPTREENQFVAYRQVPAFSIQATRPLQLNLDGEPCRDTQFEFSVLPQALPVIAGPDAPCVVAQDN